MAVYVLFSQFRNAQIKTKMDIQSNLDRVALVMDHKLGKLDSFGVCIGILVHRKRSDNVCLGKDVLTNLMLSICDLLSTRSNVLTFEHTPRRWRLFATMKFVVTREKLRHAVL
jgi:hypothetical protein